MTTWNLDSESRIDRFVEAFESARAAGIDEPIENFLPSPDDPLYPDVVVEMVRVEYELRSRAGTPPRLEEFFRRFPEVFDLPERRALLAYEEYRIRRQLGESVSRESLAQAYGIAVDMWPELPVGPSSPSLAERSAGVGAKRAAFPEVGRRFHQYELVGVLGEGALGRVYLARQEDLANRFVVLKVSLHHTGEPQTLARLQHAQIVPVYSVHHEDDFQVICMPFLGANTLADVLRTIRRADEEKRSGETLVSTLAERNRATVLRDSSVTPDDLESVESAGAASSETLQQLRRLSYRDAVLSLMERVAAGLAYAHTHGVVHSDLKPANILLSDHGDPLLLDFHLATVASDRERAPQVVGGTVPYMAPEHLQAVREGRAVGPEADVYSFGVILYELLSGQLPFPGHGGTTDTELAQMEADRRGRLPRLRQVVPGVSPAVDAIVTRCLQPDPQARYRSAVELHEDLSRHLKDLPLAHAPNRSWIERTRKWARRHPQATSGTAVGVVATLLLTVAVVAGLANWMRWRRAEAVDTLRALRETMEQAQVALAVPDLPMAELETTARKLAEFTATYHLGQPIYLDIARQRRTATHLPDELKAELNRDLVRLLALRAVALARLSVRTNGPGPSSQLDEALVHVRAALAARPEISSLQTLARRIELLQKRADAQSLAPLSGIDWTVDESTADRALLSAFIASQVGDYRQARRLLQRRVEEPNAQWTDWFSLGNAHLALGENREAEAAYTTCLALQPHSALARFYRGVARLNARRYEAAVRDFDLLADHRSLGPAARINRAIAHAGQQRYRQAIADLDDAQRAGATQTRLFFLRARYREALGDRAGAAADRQQGLKVPPSDPLSWVALGIAQLRDDPTKALQSFQEALVIDPGCQEALQNMAHVLAERLQSPAKALPYLDRLVELQPENPARYAQRGVVRARAKRAAGAKQDARRALRQQPSPLITLQTACIFSLLAEDDPANVDPAVSLVRQALAKQPQLVAIAAADPDLNAVRNDDRFRRIIDASRTLVRPESATPTAHSGGASAAKASAKEETTEKP